MIMSAEFACRAAYSVQLPSYKLNFEEKLLASKARKRILAVTPTSEWREIHVPVPHDTTVSFDGSSSVSKKARISCMSLYRFVSGSRSFWNGKEIEPGMWPEDNPGIRSELEEVTFPWFRVVAGKSIAQQILEVQVYLPMDLASKIWTEPAACLAISVICSNDRTNVPSLWGTGYFVTGYGFGGDDSSGPPSRFHAGNPPLRTDILLCPKTLNVHHTRGDEKMPWVS